MLARGRLKAATIACQRLTQGLPPILAEAFPGLTIDAQRAVQLVRSTPGVDVALDAMKVEHVEDILAAMRKPPASRDALLKLLSPPKQ